MENASVKYVYGAPEVLAFLDSDAYPHNEDAASVRNYLRPLVEQANSSGYFIKNVQCEFGLLVIGAFCFPTTLSKPLGRLEMCKLFCPSGVWCNREDGKKGWETKGLHNTCYVTSPFLQYTRYIDTNARKLKLNLFLQMIIQATLAWLAAVFFVTELDRVVYVNNFLLGGSNLWPCFKQAYSSEEFDQILKRALGVLRDFHPDRIVLFKSIDDRGTSCVVRDSLRRLGARKILSSQVYYQNVLDKEIWKKRSLRSDFSYSSSMFSSGAYFFYSLNLRLDSFGNYKMQGREGEWGTIGSGDLRKILSRIVELYEQLYLEKYSSVNPRFSSRFILDCILSKFLTVQLLIQGKKSFMAGDLMMDPKNIQGVIGYWSRGGILTTPLLGYDTSLPERNGLYRMLCLAVMIVGRDHNLLINAGAGAGDFKRRRGAESFVEYNTVFAHRELPLYRKMPWIILEWMTRIVILASRNSFS